jgi:hypothetical protein
MKNRKTRGASGKQRIEGARPADRRRSSAFWLGGAACFALAVGIACSSESVDEPSRPVGGAPQAVDGHSDVDERTQHELRQLVDGEENLGALRIAKRQALHAEVDAVKAKLGAATLEAAEEERIRVRLSELGREIEAASDGVAVGPPARPPKQLSPAELQKLDRIKAGFDLTDPLQADAYHARVEEMLHDDSE